MYKRCIFNKYSQCVSGLWPSSGILDTRMYKTQNFRKLDLLTYSGEERETLTLLDPLERDNPIRWTFEVPD
jgi:hypothetical protein